MARCKTWHLTPLIVPFGLLLIQSPGLSQDAGTADRKATRGLPRHPAAGDADDIHRMRMRIRRCGVILVWTDRDGEVFGEEER